MKDRNLTYRILLVVGLLLLAMVYLVPALAGGWPSALSFLPDEKIRLGLDLQGGTHLVLTVEVDKAIENMLELESEELRRELRQAGVRPKAVERNGIIGLRVTGIDPEGPWAASGVRVGEAILALDGVAVTDPARVARVARAWHDGRGACEALVRDALDHSARD